MATATNDTPAARPSPKAAVPAIAAPRLPYHPALQERFGIDAAMWRALVEAIFPLAQSIESVILALSYCKARKLDPFKRNVHIVPIWDSERRGYVDTVWPGIGELRTTAFRTGLYAGRDDAQLGPDITETFRDDKGEATVTFPEWCQVTVYRMVRGARVAFTGPRVYWLETYATRGKSDRPNDMWTNRPRGQLEKCAEAAALRAAFPEELGNEYCADEVGHVRGGAGTMIDAKPAVKSLEDLSERYGKLDTEGAILTKEGAMELAAVTAGQESHGEPHAESSAAPAADDHFTRAAAAFEAAKTLDDVQAVWDSLKGVELPAEQDFRLDELGRHATERIKAAKKK